MKKLFCFLIFVFTINNLLAQTENYTIAIERFQKDYNSGKYDAIFNSFSPEMKQELPLEKTKEFLSGLKAQVGNIENKEFIKYQQNTYASYKTQFEKAVLEVSLSLDSQNTINGFFIKPYEAPKEAQTKTVNTLNTYPQEIADIIYSKSKDFPNQTQLSIAVVKNGKTSYYGIIKENDSLKPVSNQNKIFEIGSLTKVFTSTVLASLVEKNKLKLTDYINSYYPFSFKDNIRISFESLANHTSGLPRLPQNLDLSSMSNPYKNYHSKELDEYLKNLMKLENESSKVFSYSNLGTGLLGNTLGLSQKTSFLKLLQNIFDKYKMSNSFTSSENLGNKLIKGHNKNGDTVSNWDFDVLFGAGGILSTTEDLVKFANAQFDPKNKELALTRKPTFTINDKMQMGLGWHIIKTTNGQELVWHNGGTGGYSSSMAINVNNRSAVIILSNVSEINDAVDNLCFELIKDPLKN